MKNKKISVTAVSIVLLATTSAIFANFDLTDLTKYNPEDKESVIDAVLNGKTLSSSEELIKESIIKEREYRKNDREKHEKIRSIEEKVRAGETLSDDEQSLLDTFKANEPKGPELLDGPIGKDLHKHGPKHGDELRVPKHLYDNLSDDEKSEFDNMSESDKKTFLDSKREEERNYKELKEKVMYNLVSGVKLTSEEEKIRKDIKIEMDEKIAREAEHEEIRSIEEKVRNGETLSDEEEAKLEEFKSNRP